MANFGSGFYKNLPDKTDGVLPRYPVFIPSKGRASDRALTAKRFIRDGIPFHLVVEPQEQKEYEEMAGPERVLVLPFRDQGATPARNWIMDYAREHGHERHWQIDDNTTGFYRWWKGKRIYCRGGVALRVCEDLSDRYENVGISGLNYDMFVIAPTSPFALNCHVYSCMLINGAIPYRWRGKFNMDTDLCLQVLTGGWCTIQLNAFSVKKMRTMVLPGGHTEGYEQDGRLQMARILERAWPGVVETKRRFQRPQHVVKGTWRYFDTQLKLKPGIDLSALPKVDDYGMELKAVSEIKSPRIQAMMDERAAPAEGTLS